MVLLEKLNPKERAVFILKEGFGYTHEEIADVLSSTVENSRKLLSRAKEKLKPAKRSIKVSNPPVNEFLIVEKYINAIRGRDIPTLEHLLTYDISAYADGGDKIKVVKKICVGLQEVIELQMYVYHTFNKNISIANCVVNHQPALLYYQEGKIRACQVFDISVDGKIFRIYTVIDPQKLKTLEMSWQNGQLTHRVDL